MAKIAKNGSRFSIEKLAKIYLLLQFSCKMAEIWYTASMGDVLKILCENFKNFHFWPKYGVSKSKFGPKWTKFGL